jgi:hypothetical protein
MKRRKSERLSRAVAAGPTSSPSTTAAPASTRRSSSAKRKPQKMDFIAQNDANKQHQEQQKPSAASSSLSNAAANFYNLLDDNCRLKIFSCLTWQDLAVAAQTSKVFRDDCRHPSLTQNADREITVTVRGRCGDLYRLLRAMADSNRFATYPKLKVVRRGRLESTTGTEARRIRDGRTLPHIASLELSFDPYDDTDETVRHRKLNPGIEARLWRTVAEHLPNLVHLTVSHDA